MPRYGPWIQESDFSQTSFLDDDYRVSAGDALGVTLQPSAYAYGSVDSEGGPAQFTDGSLSNLFALLEDNVAIGDRDIATSSLGATRVERRSSLVDPGIGLEVPSQWINEGAVIVSHHPFPIRFQTSLWFPPSGWPEGATGIEYDDAGGAAYPLAFPSRVGLDLLPGTELRRYSSGAAPGQTYTARLCLAQLGRAQEETYYGPPSPGQSGLTYTIDTRLESTTSGTSTATVPFGSETDLSTYGPIDDAAGGMVLYTINTPFVDPADGSEFDEWWAYGVRFHRPQVRFTYHPPAYRWIYDTETIRRTWPRDDTRRTWPRPTSEQASNRTWGGYF